VGSRLSASLGTYDAGVTRLLNRAPRLAALGLGVALLVGIELLLRVAGVADPRDRPDPFGGFSPFSPTFALETDAAGRRIYVAKESQTPTRRFLAEKPDNGFRVFVFGGSTEAGTPYGYDYAFAEFLRGQLAQALPQRHVEVVNVAAPGYASRRLLYLAREAEAFEPDLFVISTGHNEVVEQRLYAHLYEQPQWSFELQQALRQLRLYGLVEGAAQWLREPARPELDSGKVYAPVFGPFASKYWQDAPRDVQRQRTLALSMFRSNVDQMIRIAERAGADVLLLSQSKNYADWPATGDTHAEEMPPADLAAWERHVARADAFEQAGDSAGAIRELEAALRLDPGFTRVHWRLAQLHRERGEHVRAYARYREAHNTALANFGTTPLRNRALRELADERDTLWLDVDRVFEDESSDRLVGFNYFIDFLHPNLAGHLLIARRSFELLRDEGIPLESDRWQEPRELARPENLHRQNPSLRVREVKNRIVAEMLSERGDLALAYLDQLRSLAPDDPQIPRIESWMAGEGQLDFGIVNR